MPRKKKEKFDTKNESESDSDSDSDSDSEDEGNKRWSKETIALGVGVGIATLIGGYGLIDSDIFDDSNGNGNNGNNHHNPVVTESGKGCGEPCATELECKTGFCCPNHHVCMSAFTHATTGEGC